MTFGYPASIHVNGVTVVDLFPDWYDVLKGSGIGLPQSQSNQPAMSGDYPKTGLSGSCPERGVSTSKDWPRDHNKSGAFTAGKPSPMSRSGHVNRELIESDSETGGSEPMSRSLLPQTNPNGASVTTT